MSFQSQPLVCKTHFWCSKEELWCLSSASHLQDRFSELQVLNSVFYLLQHVHLKKSHRHLLPWGIPWFGKQTRCPRLMEEWNCKGNMLIPWGNSTASFYSIPAELESGVSVAWALQGAIGRHWGLEGRWKEEEWKLLIEGECLTRKEAGIKR